MKVQLLVPRATATGAQNRGDVIEVSDAEAVRMVEAGQAAALEPLPEIVPAPAAAPAPEAIEGEPAPETADADPAPEATKAEPAPEMAAADPAPETRKGKGK